MNQEIFEGLKAALERKQSLKRAMMSFFNAGYSKPEIEEAAGALSQVPIREVIQQPKLMPEKQINQIPPKQREFFPQVKTEKQITPVMTQKVSDYENSTAQKSDKLIVIILISVLVFLLGILATVFFFKEEIMSWFGR